MARPGIPSPCRLLPFLPSFLLAACLFETETPPPVSADFVPELSRLASARDPILAALGAPPGGSVVAMQFAFTSLDYARQADSNVEAFHAETGVYPAAVGAYFDFTTQPNKLAIFLQAVWAKGYMPSVTLDPKDFSKKDDPKAILYQRTFLGLIDSGHFDPQLDAWASVMRDFGHPVLLRFAHEMNGDWYPYGGGGDADGDGKPDGPEAFIRAWRHAHDRFEAAGARNLIWAFCPNGEDFPDAAWNRPFRYYPGDAYANLILVDAYEHHDKRSQSLAEALDPFLGRLGGFLRDRLAAGDSLVPAFGIGEFGTNRTDPQAKADWYGQALLYLGGDDRIRFHALYDGRNGDEDFSLQPVSSLIGNAYDQPTFRYRLFDPVPG
jgi:hypothetical protein